MTTLLLLVGVLALGAAIYVFVVNLLAVREFRAEERRRNGEGDES